MSVAHSPRREVSKDLRAAPDKLELIRWADSRREIDLESKVILQKLAFFTEGDGRTWRKVADLAADANCSIRTVHTRLRRLEEGGYIKQSGEVHRLRNSTRSVPKYVLQPTFEAEEAAESMCANSAYIGSACMQVETGMCATGCTCKETQESSEVSDETSSRARESLSKLDEVYRGIEAAYPVKGLGWTDPAMARAALADVVGQGVSGAELIAAAAAYAADPVLKRRDFGPVSLQRWLSEGRYRGWLGADVEPAEACAWAGPADLRAAVVAAKGEAFVRALLDPAEVEGGTVRPQTPFAYRQLAELGELFASHGADLVAPAAVPVGGNR